MQLDWLLSPWQLYPWRGPWYTLHPDAMGVAVLLALGKPKHWDPFKEGTHIIYLYIYICSMFNIFQFQWEAVLTWYVGVACNCMWIWYIIYIYINRCTKYELAFPLATKNQRANELRPESHWFTWKLVNMTPPQGPDMKWYDLYKQHNKKKHGFPKKNPFFFVWSWFFKLEEHHFTDLKYQVSGWVVCNHL